LARHLDDAHRGERVREGYRIAIIGAPNVGKSSLLNALARRDASIVSDLPGTTRDVVEIRLVLGGFPVWIADTAGLREAADAIEAEGVRRALARAEDADLRLGVVEAGAVPDLTLQAALRPSDLLIRSKSDASKAQDGTLDGAARPAGEALNRPGAPAEPWQNARPQVQQGLKTSAKTGEGIAELEKLLRERVIAALGREEAPALTRIRHRRLVEQAQAATLRARDALEAGAELAAEDLRGAGHALGRLTGRIDVEDLLDEIFSSFCIGK
jgi:tRNA modification GTPase